MNSNDLKTIKRQLVIILNYLGFITGVLLALSFFSIVKADPNMEYDAPVAGEYTDLPTQQNMTDLKAIFKDIRKLNKHQDAQYIHLHKKERNMLKKLVPTQPSLDIYLR